MKTLPEIQTEYRTLNNLLYQSYLPAIINAAVEAGIFQALHENEQDIDRLSEALKTDKNITEALCQVLVSIGLMETRQKKYRLAPVSTEFLQPESPVNQLMDIQNYSGSPGPFDNLLNALKGEKTKFNSKQWADKKAALQMEQGAKAGAIQNVVRFVTSLPGFRDCRKMCDLAGNIGHYSAAVCAENENLHAHVFDLPEVVIIASETRQEDIAGRITFHGCDIMQDGDFGKEYDLFFISHFLYGHSIDKSLVPFLRKVNQAMVKGGIFVSHHISDDYGDGMQVTMKIIELMTKAMGYPTHELPAATLKNALAEAGFSEFSW